MKRMMFIGLVAITSVAESVAQCGAGWLEDEKYRGDGKAEFNIYDAQVVRYGEARVCGGIHIYVRGALYRIFGASKVRPAWWWVALVTLPSASRVNCTRAGTMRQMNSVSDFG